MYIYVRVRTVNCQSSSNINDVLWLSYNFFVYIYVFSIFKSSKINSFGSFHLVIKNKFITMLNSYNIYIHMYVFSVWPPSSTFSIETMTDESRCILCHHVYF